MLRYMTSGESHGKGLLAIIDGVPAGFKLDEKAINKDLARRMSGYGRGGRMKIEKDRIELVSGTRKGRTIGSPVGILIKNRDHKIEKLPAVKCPRPGHADLAGILKYGFDDARNVLERASARETAARVAAGGVAKLILREFGIKVISHIRMVGGIEAFTAGMTFDEIDKKANSSSSKLRCADTEAEKLMCEAIDEAREDGDTLGGTFEVICEGVPVGLGSHAQWDRRIDAAISRAVVSIPAVKAVEIGNGIDCAYLRGSDTHDPIHYDKSSKVYVRESNNAGGIEGGITNGLPVVVRGYMKPIATLSDPLSSVNISTKSRAKASTERSDVSAVAACGVVGEAVVAMEIASFFLEKFGSDSIEEIWRNYEAYLKALRKM